MNESQQILFTPAALLDLLSQIDELKDRDVGVVETADGRFQVKIGESTYTIDTSQATDVEVPADVVDTVEDVNEDAYMNMEESGEIDITDGEPVESGLIKELAKSLLLGGMIRLSRKLLK